MYDDWKDSGAPLGALAEPRPVYRSPGHNRGKLHLSQDCRPDLVEADQVALTDLDENTVCSNCCDYRTYDEGQWHHAVSEVLAQRESIDLVLETLDGYGDDRPHSVGISIHRWATRALFDLQLRFPTGGHVRGDRYLLHTWAKTELGDRNDQARDRWRAASPHLFDQWPLRWDAARVVNDLGLNCVSTGGFPATRVGTNAGWSAGLGHDGQGKANAVIRGAVSAAVRRGATQDQCRAAGTAAGEAVMATQESFLGPDQIPLDAAAPDGTYTTVHEFLTAAWRVAVAAEIATLADTYTRAAFKAIRAHQDAPLEAVVFLFPTVHGEADAVILDYATSCLPSADDSYLRVLCWMPATLVAAVRTDRQHRASLQGSFGTVQAGDTVETFAAADQLRRTADVGWDNAADVARSSMLPQSA